MPGRPEFLQPVGGRDGDAISTNADGTIETNNYKTGAKLAGSAYPLSLDPAFSIEEWALLINPGGKEVTIVTVDGDTISDVPLGNATGAFDTISIDSLTIKDAEGTGGETSILVAGE